MSTLKSEKRDTALSGKKLRRDGIIPAILYGKNLESSVALQLPQSDAESFLKRNTIGSRTDLFIGKKKYQVLLKEIAYTPVKNKIEHISFQNLTSGEKVKSSAHIIFINKDSVEGIVQQSLNEIEFKALPEDLFDTVEIDLADFKIGDSLKVSDLPIAQNEHIAIITALDSLVVSVSAPKEEVEETPEGEEAAEAVAETETPEVPLVAEES